MFGALPQDWNFLTFGCDLTADLLPVVSNPDAQISPASKMKGLGKTPSVYNARRQVVGISKWTSLVTSDDDVSRWMPEKDYGICIQTRRVRALDIDVADEITAGIITAQFENELGLRLPIRFRQNSGKCLLAFELEGDYFKRAFKVDGGIVEFLANGQQFVAYGTHTSVVRYQWDMQGNFEFPRVPVGAFEKAWDKIISKFAVSDVKFASGNSKVRSADLDIFDPVVDQLEVLDTGPVGQLYIRCPFEANHSSDTGIGQTCYFPAGVGGYQHGHFKCLHASCQGHTDQDFLDGLGVVIEHPETLGLAVVEENDDEVSVDGEPMPRPMDPLSRDRNGVAKATVDNVCLVLSRDDITGSKLRYDSFQDQVIYNSREKPDEWKNFTDNDYTRLRRFFDRFDFQPVSNQLIRDCVFAVASENSFDSAVDWLGKLKWDGVPRVDTFFETYANCTTDSQDYVRAASRYLWAALAGRVLAPGIKADMAPILVGAQGLGKSTLIEKLSPKREYFTELEFTVAEAENSRKMRGCLVAELPELRGMSNTGVNEVKAFIGRTHEKWTPKFKEFTACFARRLVFLGTTNSEEFLLDQTGNRRFLPLLVGRCDFLGVERDRDQLWAEGREIFKSEGIFPSWQAADKTAALARATAMVRDSWQDAILEWFYLPSTSALDDTERNIDRGDRDGLLTLEIARGALNIEPRQLTKRDEDRINKALTVIGCERKSKNTGVDMKKVWYPPKYLL